MVAVTVSAVLVLLELLGAVGPSRQRQGETTAVSILRSGTSEALCGSLRWRHTVVAWDGECDAFACFFAL